MDSEQMTRYFFDISDIATYIRSHSSISGIQRATVMILSEAIRDLDPEQVYLSYRLPGGKRYYAQPAAGLMEALVAFDTRAIGAGLGVQAKAVPPETAYLERYATRPLKRWFHNRKLQRAGKAGNRRFFEKRGVSYDAWEAWHLRNQRPGTAPAPGDFFDIAQAGDRLCMLGIMCGQPELQDMFRRAAGQGVAVYAMVHDLIPYKLPSYTDPNFSTLFQDWLADSPEYCAGYLTNSQSTANDLADFLAPLGIEVPIHVTALAQAPLKTAETSPCAEAADDTRPAEHAEIRRKTAGIARLQPPARMAANLPYVLCVGTIEPRKNLWRLTQAWARLSREPGLDMPRLVLAGKRGWLVDDLMETLTRTGGMGGWITHVEAPRDDELDFLYRNCLFTTKVSLYEGWGLPIGEGLSYGKTGVVSQTSSMPEVGGDLVEYCDPHSIDSIAAACRRLIADPAHREAQEARIAETALRGWDDVGRDVMEVLKAPVRPAA